MTVAPAHDTEVLDTPLGTFEVLRDDVITEQLRRTGGHQRSDLAAALSCVRRGDTVLDVGAHVGTFAIPFARVAGESGRVIAFEPTPRSHALLRANAARNGMDRVTTVQALVSDAEGRFGATEVDGNSGMTWFRGGQDGDLPAIRLDGWWEQSGRPAVHLLKIDVEGMELRVLEGGAALVEARRPVVIAELSASQLARTGDSVAALERWLKQRDYRLFVNLHPRNDGSDAFELARLPRLSLLRVGGPGFGLRDVIAIHRDSDRMPARTLSAVETARRLAGARARDVADRARRRHRHGSEPARGAGS